MKLSKLCFASKDGIVMEITHVKKIYININNILMLSFVAVFCQLDLYDSQDLERSFRIACIYSSKFFSSYAPTTIM